MWDGFGRSILSEGHGGMNEKVGRKLPCPDLRLRNFLNEKNIDPEN
jgi:hypothetical protein